MAKANRTKSKSTTENRMWLVGNENPMINQVVLKHFFDVIPFNYEDFQNFRQVCHSWEANSLERWRKETWLTLKDGAESPKLSHSSYMELFATEGDPHQLIKNKKFIKYKVTMKEDLVLTNNKLQFWQTVGPTMTHLKIVDSTTKKSLRDSSRQFPYEEWQTVLFDMTPNLTYLCLENNDYDGQTRKPFPMAQISDSTQYRDPSHAPSLPEISRSDLLPSHFGYNNIQRNLKCLEMTMSPSSKDFNMTWPYFLPRLPNIQTLKLQGFQEASRSQFFPDDPYPLFDFLQSIQLIRRNCGEEYFAQLHELSILNMQIKTNSSIPRAYLNELRFPLTSLAIDVGYTSLKDILEPYSVSLQKLVVYRAPHIHVFSHTYPFGMEFHQMTELSLIGTSAKNLNFLKDLPNEPFSYLNFCLPEGECKLHYQKYETDYLIRGTHFEGIFLNNLVLRSLEEFIVGEELCYGRQVKFLGKMMPNLKKLRLGLQSDSFEAVCKIWGKLQHLDIQPFNVNEEELLGIENGERNCKPNLIDLKELTSIRLGKPSQDFRWKWQFTDDSIVHGLLAMESLKDVRLAKGYLKILRRNNKDVKEMLLAKFPQCV